jgi:hypothetical protein
MKVFVVIMLALTLAGQTLAYKIVNCNVNSDCTNFDGTGTASCCYNLKGVTTTGAAAQ